MLSTLFLFARRSTSRTPAPRAPGGPRFRPRLEGFEDRVVPAAPVMEAALAAPAAASPASLLPINLSSATLDPVTGALSAVGTIGNQAFNLAGTLTLAQSADGTTPILQLHIPDGIHLDLLGLKVDTSPICLDITASSGPGQLLGNLLTDLSGLLNGGGTLPTLGDALSGLDLTGVENELTQVLNQGLGTLFSPTAASGGSVTQSTGSTSILHLELGPVNLSLLGLNVRLDDCSGGPVTVDITAQSGPGQLLGNLLTSVSHLLDGPANTQAVTNALDRVAGAVGNILNQV